MLVLAWPAALLGFRDEAQMLGPQRERIDVAVQVDCDGAVVMHHRDLAGQTYGIALG